MTSTRTLRSTLALVVVLAGAPARAQDVVTLTVDDAVTRALAHAPRLAEARARERGAEAGVDARAAAGRPTFGLASSLLRTNHVDEFGIPQADGSTRVIFPDIPTNYRVRAELAVPLYTGGRVDALVGAARADRRAVEADRRAAAADIQLETVSAYWTLALARDRVGVLERSLERADAVVSDASARVDAGLVPPNERLSAEARRAMQRVALVRARNAAAVAEAQVGRLVGLDPDTAVMLATPLAAADAGAAALAGQPQATLLQQATDARPERLALVERQAAAQAQGEAAAAARRPQVAVLAAVEPARPNARFVPRSDQWQTSWDLGVNVNWSFWDGGRARAERAGARAQADALAARVADLDAGIAVELRQRQLDVEAGRAAVAAGDEAVAAATEARRVVGERFAVGVATSTELLDADVVQLEAELERAQALAELRVNEARLVRAVGGGQ